MAYHATQRSDKHHSSTDGIIQRLCGDGQTAWLRHETPVHGHDPVFGVEWITHCSKCADACQAKLTVCRNEAAHDAPCYGKYCRLLPPCHQMRKYAAMNMLYAFERSWNMVMRNNFAVSLDGFATAHRLRRHALQAYSRTLFRIFM